MSFHASVADETQLSTPPLDTEPSNIKQVFEKLIPSSSARSTQSSSVLTVDGESGNQIDTISSYSAAAGLPAPGSASASTIAISSALPPRPIHSAHSLFVADPSSDSFVFESPGLS